MSGSVRLKKGSFVLALVSGASVAEAAASVGRCERTGARWLASDDLVQTAIAEAQDSLLRELAMGCLGAARDSIGVLESVRDDPTTAPYVKVSAAKTLLDAGLRLAELVSLSARVSSIEQALALVNEGDEWR